jgi:hypothetical protein
MGSNPETPNPKTEPNVAGLNDGEDGLVRLEGLLVGPQGGHHLVPDLGRLRYLLLLRLPARFLRRHRLLLVTPFVLAPLVFIVIFFVPFVAGGACREVASRGVGPEGGQGAGSDGNESWGEEVRIRVTMDAGAID